MKDKKRQFGEWYTLGNPFKNIRVAKWLDIVRNNNLLVVEPFVGTGNLVQMLPDINWQGFYDINPQGSYLDTSLRNSLRDFPKFCQQGNRFQAVITNPPWLSKNSASLRKLEYDDEFKFDDLYKQALYQCLNNCDYVLAIVPESFVRSGLFRDRLEAVILLNFSIFGDETEHPSCVALFCKEVSNDFEVWEGENFIGMHSHLNDNPITKLDVKKIVPFKFNATDGEIILHGLDRRSGPTIRFSPSSSEGTFPSKFSNRHVCRIKIPSNLIIPDFEKFILAANKVLEDFRNHTHDVGLNSSKSRRKDGRFRRRLDFDTARRILTLASLF